MAKCFFVNGTASWYGPDLTCLPIGTHHTPRATCLTRHVSRLRAAPGDPARADHGPAQLHLLPLRDDLQLPAGLPGQPRPRPQPSPRRVCRWWAGPRASARLTARGPAATCPRVSRSSATSPTTPSTVSMNTSSLELDNLHLVCVQARRSTPRSATSRWSATSVTMDTCSWVTALGEPKDL